MKCPQECPWPSSPFSTPINVTPTKRKIRFTDSTVSLPGLSLSFFFLPFNPNTTKFLYSSCCIHPPAPSPSEVTSLLPAAPLPQLRVSSLLGCSGLFRVTGHLIYPEAPPRGLSNSLLLAILTWRGLLSSLSPTKPFSSPEAYLHTSEWHRFGPKSGILASCPSLSTGGHAALSWSLQLVRAAPTHKQRLFTCVNSC